MVKDKKKLLRAVVLCACGAALLAVTIGIAVAYTKRDGNKNGPNRISWASKAVVDSNELYPVIFVVDGDTIKVEIDGHVISVRLLGINTPETVDPRKPVECFGVEASRETKALLAGKEVSLSLNPRYERVDMYGRLLAYVRLPGSAQDGALGSSTGLFVNEYLVKEGYAYEYTFNDKNPYQYQSEFKRDQAEARTAKKGLWGKCESAGL